MYNKLFFCFVLFFTKTEQFEDEICKHFEVGMTREHSSDKSVYADFYVISEILTLELFGLAAESCESG